MDARLLAQITALERFYGRLPAPPDDPFALFVWEVLGAQSTPGKRDAAFAAVKRARALTPDGMARAPAARLEAAVALAGAYREQRLSALGRGVERFRRQPRLPAVIRGPLRIARRALGTMPQLGEGGAHRMLLFAAGYPVLPVDAGTHRLGVRLGYARSGGSLRASIRALRRRLTRALAFDTAALRRACVYLSHHAAATCTEGDPHCAVCPLLEGCPDGRRRQGGAAAPPPLRRTNAGSEER